jgi:hypothetical protein
MPDADGQGSGAKRRQNGGNDSEGITREASSRASVCAIESSGGVVDACCGSPGLRSQAQAGGRE